MWISHWIQAFAGKGFEARILLAEGSFGCSRSGSKVRKMSKMCKGPEATFVAHSANTTNLAIAKTGVRFVRSASTVTRQLEVCCSSSGIFSKWIEAKPLATITSATVQKFF
jgi:transposase InsO family protein